MIEQVIYSRYQYHEPYKTSKEIFEEYNNMFDVKYCDERGVVVGGVSVAYEVAGKNVIILTYDAEADAFLRLKIYNRKDVKVNHYIGKK